MVRTLLVRLRSGLAEVIRNPHFWVVVILSIGLLLLYRAWPWSTTALSHGVWRYFQWLSGL